MSPTTTSTIKRTTRARKTITAVDQVVQPTSNTTVSSKTPKPLEDAFAKLVVTITNAKEEYEALQKQIKQTKEAWEEEQRLHVIKMQERDQQEELIKKREKETYEYDIKLARKKDEDEFLERKVKWERDLQFRKDEIEKEKQELADLRKQVAGFEAQVAKAVKEATDVLRKELTDSFEAETKLREQEIKSEKELLALKITTLTQENTRQSQEIALLKKSLENATVQLKDVAVKVIESSGNKPQASGFQE